MSHSFAPRAQKLVRKLCLELLKSSKKIRCADLPLRGPLRGGLVSERTRCLSVRFYSPGATSFGVKRMPLRRVTASKPMDTIASSTQAESFSR